MSSHYPIDCSIVSEKREANVPVDFETKLTSGIMDKGRAVGVASLTMAHLIILITPRRNLGSSFFWTVADFQHYFNTVQEMQVPLLVIDSL